MKKLLLLTVLLSSFAFGQKKKSIDKLSYTDFERDLTKELKNNAKVSSYEWSKGNFVSQGDTLTIGQPSGINTSTHGRRTTAAHETLVMGSIGMAALSGGDVSYATSDLSGAELIVEKIRFTRRSMGRPESLIAIFIPAEGTMIGGRNKMYTINLDKSLNSGELVSKNTLMTREEALDILKSKKEELDLEIISQEEYDKIKRELMPTIKEN